MSTPMYDLPTHLKIGVDSNGGGPVAEQHPDFDHWECWCGEPTYPCPVEAVDSDIFARCLLQVLYAIDRSEDLSGARKLVRSLFESKYGVDIGGMEASDALPEVPAAEG